MRAVLQRVTEASVTVDGQVIGEIGKGIMVLFGMLGTDTDKTIEPIFWIDELSYTYETTGSDTPVNPDTPVTPEPGTPEVTGNDVSDEIKVGDHASCSIDTTVSHDGVQSMKVTGKSYTEQGSSAYAA